MDLSILDNIAIYTDSISSFPVFQMLRAECVNYVTRINRCMVDRTFTANNCDLFAVICCLFIKSFFGEGMNGASFERRGKLAVGSY